MRTCILEGFSNYEFNELGEVRNIKTGRKLKSQRYVGGYAAVKLIGDNKLPKWWLIHRVVAKHFVDNPNGYEIVNHIDENKMNPKASNLEWVTHEENMTHGSRNKRISKGNQYPICEYDLEGRLIRIWRSAVLVSKVYPISTRTVNGAASFTGKEKTAYGRQWRYYRDTKGKKIAPVSDSYFKFTKIVAFNHNVSIPLEYLYTATKGKARCLELIDFISSSDYLTVGQVEALKEIREYVTKRID